MAAVLARAQTHPIFAKIARFALVGLLGTAIDLGLFALLHLLVGLPGLLANTLSYSAGIVNNFVLHRRWTFHQANTPDSTLARSPTPAVSQFARFAAVSLSALALNNAIVALLTPVFAQLLPEPDLAAVPAKLFAIAAGMAWNFFANHLWTFRDFRGSTS